MDAGAGDQVWEGVLAGDAAALAAMPLYAPLRAGPLALGRIAQSLDGRIATPSGHSFWISGEADLLHTHRLRALFDAVLVGAGTVRADDPLLTTRRCAGPSPVRVVLDAARRLGPDYQIFAGPPRTIVLCAPEHADKPAGAAEIVPIPRGPAGLDLTAALAALAERGLTRIFVEGGGVTVSRFLAAGLLDRLHVTVAPLLLGEGIPAFALPPVARPSDALRLAWQIHRLGDDVLFDIPLRP